MFTHTQIARTTKGNNSKRPSPTAPIFFSTIQLVILVMCTKFQDSRYSILEKSLTQNKCLLNKKAEQQRKITLKGPGFMTPIYFCTIQLVILVMCTKFQDCRYSSS